MKRTWAYALVIHILACSAVLGAAIPTDGRGLPLWEIAVFEDFPVRMELSSPAELSRLLQAVPLAGFGREQIQPDHRSGGIVFTPRVTAAEARDLESAGYRFTRLPDLDQAGRRATEESWAEQAAKGFAGFDPAKALYYPTHAQVGSDFAALAATHPTLARTFTWGTSVQGRELWGIVISDDVHNTEPEPEVRLSSTIHGNETVGLVLLWNLAHYLLDNYGQPGFEDLTALVDGAEIHIMPLHNPDGYALAWRSNANGVDLNRNYPDPAGTHSSMEVETTAFMAYANAHHFVISQNGHGGALVVNYPWDYTYTRAPDDAALIQLSLEYSTYNLPMYNGAFPQGITNGADWYIATGTLQDWSYYSTDCIDVTVELGNNKWPAPALLDTYWNDNRESLLHYVAAARHGISGVVTDAVSGLPLDATITVAGNAMPVHTDPAHGDYYKLLPTGTFDLTFSAPGYTSQTITGVACTWGVADVLDVALEPLGPMETVTLFASDFEAGTAGWTGGWGLAIPAEGHDSTNSLDDSPGADYASDSSNAMTMTAGVDLSDAVTAELRFWARWDVEENYDACFLLASVNGGTTWSGVTTPYTDPASGSGVQLPSGAPVFEGVQAAWVLNVVDLAPVLGQSDVRFRFRLDSDSSLNGAGFFLDDFIIQKQVPDDSSSVPRPVFAAEVEAWPNPFNPLTTVAFTAPAAGTVRLTIHDLQGRLVRTLVDEVLTAGAHQRPWDGCADDGSRCASGVYFARMVNGAASAVTKLTLVK